MKKECRIVIGILMVVIIAISAVATHYYQKANAEYKEIHKVEYEGKPYFIIITSANDTIVIADGILDTEGLFPEKNETR